MVRALLRFLSTIGSLAGIAALILKLVDSQKHHAHRTWMSQFVQPWSIIACLFIPTALSILIRIHDRVRWYLFCPVCGNNISRIAVECTRCGSSLEDGAIPCRASDQVPDGVETSPATTNTASFADSRVIIRGDVAKLRITLGTLTFAGIFFAFGAGALVMAYNFARLPDHWLSFESIFALFAFVPLIAGLIFIAISVLIIAFPKRMRLDRMARTLYLASGYPGQQYSFDQHSTAIQILARIVSGNQLYKCYEVNLVTAKERINLLSHGEAKFVRYDAHRLADFLHVRLLDHTGEVISRPDGSPGYRLIEKGMRQKEVTLASS
jgi:hypothetical protein